MSNHIRSELYCTLIKDAASSISFMAFVFSVIAQHLRKKKWGVVATAGAFDVFGVLYFHSVIS